MYPVRDGRSCSSEPTQVDTAQRETRAKKEVDEELAMLDALECSGKPLGAKQLALSGKEVADLGNLHGSKSAEPRCALLAAVVEGEVEKHPRGAALSPEFRDRKRRRTYFSKKKSS